MTADVSRSRQTVVFGLLYVAEGAPIGFLWWALPTRLRTAGVAVDEITALTALLALPWAFKFLWAPLVDVLRTSRIGYRAWIVAAQLVMGLTLFPLLWLDLSADLATLRWLLLAHAIAAATQDVAIDALAIASVPSADRGRINGVMQAGMLVARFGFGAGVLRFGSDLGQAGIVAVLIGTIWTTTVAALSIPEPQRPTSEDRFGDFRRALAGAARRRATRLGILVALLAGLAFEAVGAVAGPFLVDHGLTEAEVGSFYAVGVGAMLVGALVGGRLADRLPRPTVVSIFVVAVAVAVGILAGADAAGAGEGVLVLLLGAIFVGIGLLTASSYALFMDLTDRRLGATQFSAYMGVTNLCESSAAFGTGRLHAVAGYPIAFAAMAAVSLLALLPLRRLDREETVDSPGAGHSS